MVILQSKEGVGSIDSDGIWIDVVNHPIDCGSVVPQPKMTGEECRGKWKYTTNARGIRSWSVFVRRQNQDDPTHISDTL